MGQLYSGNLEDYMVAVKRLNNAGIQVEETTEHYDPLAMSYNKSIELYEPRRSSRTLLAMMTFWHGDIDVFYIHMTEWLNRQAQAYESWS